MREVAVHASPLFVEAALSRVLDGAIDVGVGCGHCELS